MISAEVAPSRPLLQGLRRAPDEVFAGVDWALRRAALEGSRLMREHAPKAETTLTLSIRPQRLGPMEERFGPTVEHGRYVAEGTAGGPGRGMPPIEAIEDWIRVRRITPRNDDYSPRDLAWAIARAIQQRGTRAQDFVTPVDQDPAYRARVLALVSEGVERGLTDAGLL